MPKVIEGQLTARGLKFAIVVSRFNGFISERLLAGALDALARTGGQPDDIEVVKVPGSWELPVVVRELARQKRHDAIICLGAVIRGDTPHFDYVAGEAGRASLVRRAHLQHTGAGHRPGGRQERQQGIRRRHGRHRDGQSDAAAAPGELMPSRRRSRQRALQILYLWDARRQPVEEATAAYFDTLYSEESRSQPQRDEFVDRLVTGAVGHVEELDRRITQHAEHWRIERMPSVDRNILRLAVYEMTHSDTPAAVVIDEALELARRYSNEESVQFVNGVLDAVHRDLLREQASGDGA